jgi:uracil-DNA glycosylase family 4
MAKLTREYLEEALAQAKKQLPAWAYAAIRNAARPRAGGRSRHRDDRPSAMEKIAIAELKPAALREMGDDDLRAAWSRLHQWFANATRRKRPTETLVRAARWAQDELKRRGLAHRDSALTQAVDEIRKGQPVAKAAPVNSRDLTTEETIEQVAERGSKFSHAESGYSEPNADPATVCGACRFFLRDPQAERGSCVAVDGEVAWFGGCDLFIGAADEARSILKATVPLEQRVTVPTVGPEGAAILFIGSSASSMDAARREPLVGPAGETFAELYLRPLHVTRREVAITNAAPLLLTDGGLSREPTADELDEWAGWLEKEVDRIGPRVVVALGEQAAAALGGAADFKLPHPAAVRRFGDSGEVGRKIKQVAKALAAPPAEIEIAKADPEKRIVYGIVMDPYGASGAEPDAHNDWNSPAEIEKAAHAYAKGPRKIRLQHSGPAKAQVVETWVEQYQTRDEYLKAMAGEPHKVTRRPFGDDKIHSGAWAMGVELGEKEWAAYEAGEINAFSPGGLGYRAPVTRGEMPKVTFVELVEQLQPKPT